MFTYHIPGSSLLFTTSGCLNTWPAKQRGEITSHVSLCKRF